MHTIQRQKDSINQSIELRIVDSADGTPETGVLFNTAGLVLQYRRDGELNNTITTVTLAALTTAHADGGFLEIGNGHYRLDLPDAALATGADKVLIHGTVTGMVVISCLIELVSYNPFDAVRMGMSSLPATGTLAVNPVLASGTHTGATIPTVTNLTNAPTSGDLTPTMKASVNTEVDTALTDIGLDHLVSTAVTGTDVTDNSIIAMLASKSATADWDSYTNTSDSLEAVRDNQVSLLTNQTTINDNVTSVSDKLGTPAAASVSADILAIDNFVDGIESTLGVAGAGLTDLGGMSAAMKAEVNAEADTALTDYDGPTNAEMEARTPTAAQLVYIVANAATGLPVTFTTSGGSTTAAVLNLVDGSAASATDDQYNGRLLVFTDSTLKGVVTDITDYIGGTTTATITAIPTAPTASHNARLI